MAYRVNISATAQRQFRRLSKEVQDRLRPVIRALADEPHPSGVVKLKGFRDQYRIRVGDYRVIYRVENDKLVVLVTNIGHRREVYR